VSPPPRKTRFGATGPWPSNIDRDVDEEIAAHLDEMRAEYAAKGLSPDEADAAAARKFGNREDVAEACRLIDRRSRDQQRRTGMLTELRQDLAYALRLFKRSPGFSLVAIATLAIGMGATTTIFTLANWALLRPVPGVADPANVSVFWVGRPNADGNGSFAVSGLSYPNLTDVIPRVKSMSLGAYQRHGPVAVAGGGQAARNVSMDFVTAGYFDVLGVRMQIGRPFNSTEDTPPSPFLGAVISDRLWRSMFQRDPGVLTRPLDIAGTRFSILGVAAPEFHGTERLSNTDLWLPGATGPIVRHMPALRFDGRNRGAYHELVARLRPGATWPQAQAEFESLRAWLRDEYPNDNTKFRTTGFHLMGPIGPPPYGREMLQRVIGFAAGAGSALVLLIACANVAGLLMIRGIGRQSETGVRKALGAGRWRLIRQHLAEGMLLWTLGGVAAVGIVLFLRSTVNVASLIGIGGLEMTPPIDWRVLTFTGAISLVVGSLFSIAPALRATRAEPADTLRSATPAATQRTFAGTSLAVFQLSASLTLLVGAFLLVGTLLNLSRVPLGFDPDGVFVFHVQPSSVGYADQASLEYLNEFQRRLGQVAGVRSVAAADGAPFFGGASMLLRVQPSGVDAAQVYETPANSVFSSEYFKTLEIPLIGGRLFADADFTAAQRGESRLVVVSDGLARRLFGRPDVVGRQVEFRHNRQAYEIIGVVGTARYNSLVAEPEDMIYEPAGSRSISSGATLVVRTNRSVLIAEKARGIATDLNPSLPLSPVLSMTDAVGRSRAEWDSLARLLGILAAVAVTLACVGLYGVIAHGVAQRRREFGIRLALGATHAEVFRLVLRRTAVIMGAGLVFGLAGGYAFAQVLSTRLVGVNPLDPVWWSLAVFSLVTFTVLATVKPARAATQVDVTETLRAM
jgi:putative ABC transport system permease protein